jgi:hypothetical protein
LHQNDPAITRTSFIQSRSKEDTVRYMLPFTRFKFIMIAIVVLTSCKVIYAQHMFTINADVPSESIDSTHLQLGGSSIKGD